MNPENEEKARNILELLKKSDWGCPSTFLRDMPRFCMITIHQFTRTFPSDVPPEGIPRTPPRSKNIPFVRRGFSLDVDATWDQARTEIANMMESIRVMIEEAPENDMRPNTVCFWGIDPYNNQFCDIEGGRMDFTFLFLYTDDPEVIEVLSARVQSRNGEDSDGE